MTTERRRQLSDATSGSRRRVQLLSGLAVTERRLQVAGVSTSVLEGGAGSPILLLHGPGLRRFRPTPAFALTMLAFLARPTERTYTGFMRQCSFDLDGLRHELGQRWEPFLAYSLERARAPNAKIAGRRLREFGTSRIPPDDLARITAPTVLIWGRHDRANRLRIAEQASARNGWSLHVSENCADDPPCDQPRVPGGDSCSARCPHETGPPSRRLS